ncbi:hypothetical protein DZC73_22870 [Albitalea terrae]|uniref:MoxR-vWA-beta-propeller ternary system domain-containing protein n=1 Tax=Piscinibacter terrae TaxID=2496871 RepID=A0A3N7HK76_9BURK|nr:hypothetical protein DZC73_22870 [Albitalea terrae]
MQGQQKVCALWFPVSWFDETQRARRLLAAWRPGASAHRFAQGDLLRFAEPFEQSCDALEGWALVRQGRTLCSAPLADAELAALPAADFHVVHGAQCLSMHFDDGQPLDPAEWLATASVALHDTFDCREALPPSVFVTPVPVQDLRAIFDGKVPPASDEHREFLRAMAQSRESDGISGSSRSQQSSSRPGHALRLVLWVLVVIAVIAGVSSTGVDAMPLWTIVLFAIGFFLARSSRAPTSWTSAGAPAQPVAAARPAGTPTGTIPPRHRPRNPRQMWRDWLARLAITSQIARLLGQRQAAYVRKMLDLFESGQLDEALRHAIPLGGDNQSLGQAFGTPGARSDLGLSSGPTYHTSINLGSDLESHLRQLYRRSFEKLDREGRIDEAVFVLAELLHARQEALDYLEKHGRFKQAAELALAWDHPAAVIVRLFCLADDWRKALAVARRDNAFATAVLQMEPKWPDPARRLRQEWAHALAQRGDWLGAIDAIWPVKEQRTLAIQWLENAQAAGGRLGARALVKRAVLLPDTMTQSADRLHELRDDPELHAEREAIAAALLELKQAEARTSGIARVIAPGLVADQAAGLGGLSRNDLQRVVSLANDPWLSADLENTALPAHQRQELSQSAAPVQGRLPDAGQLAPLDAVALDDGQFLLALGETGAVIVNRHGKVQSRFAVPADQLVIAPSRQMALAVARRDLVCRVSRLDLANRQVTDLGMAELHHFAREFDGIAWTVASGNRLRVLDTQRSLNEVLWQVGDLPGKVCDLSVNSRVEQVCLALPTAQYSLWRYSLPQRRLFVRDELVPSPISAGSTQVLAPNGGVIEAWIQVDADGAQTLAFMLNGRKQNIAWPQMVAEGDPLRVVVAGSWLLAGIGDETTTHWAAIAMGNGRVCARIDWPAPSLPQARLSESHLIVFDRQGRLWALDVATSAQTSIGLR